MAASSVGAVPAVKGGVGTQSSETLELKRKYDEAHRILNNSPTAENYYKFAVIGLDYGKNIGNQIMLESALDAGKAAVEAGMKENKPDIVKEAKFIIGELNAEVKKFEQTPNPPGAAPVTPVVTNQHAQKVRDMEQRVLNAERIYYSNPSAEHSLELAQEQIILAMETNHFDTARRARNSVDRAIELEQHNATRMGQQPNQTLMNTLNSLRDEINKFMNTILPPPPAPITQQAPQANQNTTQQPTAAATTATATSQQAAQTATTVPAQMSAQEIQSYIQRVESYLQLDAASGLRAKIAADPKLSDQNYIRTADGAVALYKEMLKYWYSVTPHKNNLGFASNDIDSADLVKLSQFATKSWNVDVRARMNRGDFAALDNTVKQNILQFLNGTIYESAAVYTRVIDALLEEYLKQQKAVQLPPPPAPPLPAAATTPIQQQNLPPPPAPPTAAPPTTN